MSYSLRSRSTTWSPAALLQDRDGQLADGDLYARLGRVDERHQELRGARPCRQAVDGTGRVIEYETCGEAASDDRPGVRAGPAGVGQVREVGVADAAVRQRGRLDGERRRRGGEALLSAVGGADGRWWRRAGSSR